MKTFMRIAAVAAALAVAVPASAQQAVQTTHQQTKIGLGVAIPADNLTGVIVSGPNGIGSGSLANAPLLFVPIQIGSNLRIEPHLGYASYNDDTFNTKDRAFSLGVGGFFLKPMGQTQLYAGARLGLTWTKSEAPVGGGIGKISQTNVTFAPTLGAEYLFSPSFSMGAEGWLAYTSFGDRKGSGTLTGSTAGGSSFTTEGFFFVRCYFM